MKNRIKRQMRLMDLVTSAQSRAPTTQSTQRRIELDSLVAEVQTIECLFPDTEKEEGSKRVMRSEAEVTGLSWQPLFGFARRLLHNQKE